MPIKTLQFPALELKAATTATDEYPAGSIEGYGSTFGNTDLGNDIIAPGSFTKTLKENLPGGRIKLVDCHNVYDGTASILGIVNQAKEDKTGLFFKSKLSSVPSAQDVRTKVAEGILDALSIGFRVIKDEYNHDTDIRTIKEVQLLEISVVPWGMNPKALITGVKCVNGVREKTLCAPIDYPWDPVAAQARVLEYVGGEEMSAKSWKMFSKAFLWFDSAKLADPTAYQFLVMDVVDGELKYVYNAGKAAVAALGTKGDWDGETLDIKSNLVALEARFDRKFAEEAPTPVEVKSLLDGMEQVIVDTRFRALMRSMSGK